MLTDGQAPFRTACESVGAAVLVHVAGEIDITTAPDLAERLGEAIRSVTPPAPVVADLSGVRFLGAQGIGVLLEHQDLCLHQGSALVVVANTAAVLRPLQALELVSVLGVRSSVVDALAPA
ncbi:anti-anti-sigma factor [Lentzea albidocapillata subsp. violacea]|uniref:Anti-sigma factor antagonist n=1 Tax=Lentzea albidocapillata subsp. violacea TaxID=128104 RepID=A0A1G8UIU6_9PSEU|nr:STAS domain-containing protein [Lentzea albidocapillata]SDJ53679.1 anti-anti-sigma factor [Lentzea albidocapillata subsp. violacea]